MTSNNVEALRSLLQSVGTDATQNISTEALQSLSDKLSELMGVDVVRDAFAYNDQPHRRQDESLVNEEGLPIIDITEPTPDSVYPGRSQVSPGSNSSGLTTDEPPLISLSTLSPAERDLRKREQERILDMLEAEEALEQRKEREREVRKRREALDKRREDGTTERERLLALKETHMKMGKALLRNEIKDDTMKITSSDLTEGPSNSLKKKSVTFAEPDDVQETEGPATPPNIMEWGDVSQGRLRTAVKFSAPSFSRESERLMKLQVVERASSSGGNPNLDQKRPNIQNVGIPTGDSDDESDVGSPTLSDADDNASRQDSDTERSDLDSDEKDWDFAQHQREIALEYYRKRENIGKKTAEALTSHTHEPSEDPSVSEFPTSSKKSKIMSQFRANRLTSSFVAATTNITAASESSSQSLEPSTIIPAGAAKTLQSAIRLGKLDEQGRLVGDERGDSGSEPDDEEVARGIIELLQKGEVYNIGPEDGEQTMITVPPPTADTSNSTGVGRQSPSLPPFTPPSEPLPQKQKSSVFKIAKTRKERPQTNSNSSSASESVSTKSTYAMTSSVVERQVHPQAASSVAPVTPIVVESPSFPQNTSTRRPERPPIILASKVVESSMPSSRPSKSKGSEEEEMEKPKRVSRFKAERN